MKKAAMSLLCVIVLIITLCSSAFAQDSSMIKYMSVDSIPENSCEFAIGYYSGARQSLQDGSLSYYYSAFLDNFMNINNRCRAESDGTGFVTDKHGFTLEKASDNLYYIKLASGKYLNSNGTKDDSKLHKTAEKTERGLWRFEKQADGTFMIKQDSDDGFYYFAKDTSRSSLILVHSNTSGYDNVTLCKSFNIYVTAQSLADSYDVFVRYEKEADCTSDAVGIFKCRYCDATITREIPGTKLEHCYDVFVGYEKEADCTSDAVGIFKCRYCDATITREIPGTKLEEPEPESVTVSETVQSDISQIEPDSQSKDIPLSDNPKTDSNNLTDAVISIYFLTVFCLIFLKCLRKRKSVL